MVRTKSTMSGADGVPLSLIKALGTDVFSNRTAAMLALVGRIRRNKVLPEDVSSAMKSLIVMGMDEKVFALLEQYGFFGGGVMMAGGGGGGGGGRTQTRHRYRYPHAAPRVATAVGVDAACSLGRRPRLH